MKTVIAFIIVCLFSSSCKKGKSNNTGHNNIPEITVLIPRCEGSTIKSIAIPFNLVTNGSIINSVQLYKSPITKISEIINPVDGMYTLYHTNTSCPQKSDNVTYYFSILKSDSTKINTTPFSVYF